jgi:hypothetical protein
MTTTHAPRPVHDLDPEHPQHRARRWIITALVLAVIAVAAALVATRDDGDEPATSSSTTAPASSETTTSTTTTAGGEVDRSSAVWPAEGSGIAITDPVAAAQAFAEDFLRMQSPVVGTFRAGDSRSGEVDVQPTADGPITTVLVRQLSGEDTWSVLGASTDLIDLTEPTAGDTIASPVTVTGAALAFEGTVQVEVREDSQADAIGTGYVTGGGDIVRPFEGRIDYAIPVSHRGALVLFTTSGEDGRVWSATVVRVTFQTTGAGTVACGSYQPVREEPGAGDMEIKIFFHCDATADGELVALYRHVADSGGVLKASLTALLGGPNTAETNARITSWFSAETAEMLRSVNLEGGHAVVDFRDLRDAIPNASTSAGSARLLEELDATVFQFPSVTTAEYRINGSCEAFTEWLQLGGCEPRTRPSGG